MKTVKNTIDLESLFSSQLKAEQGIWEREVWRNLAHGMPFQYVDSRCLLFYKSIILSLKHLHKKSGRLQRCPLSCLLFSIVAKGTRWEKNTRSFLKWKREVKSPTCTSYDYTPGIATQNKVIGVTIKNNETSLRYCGTRLTYLHR